MSFWTGERVETLRKMHGQDATFATIGDALGCTRNAAIGKAMRLGLPGRKSVNPKPRVRSRSRRRKNSAQLCDIPESQRCTIMQLTARTCRFPFGDPRKPGFFFCGAATALGSPYCRSHLHVAYERWNGKCLR